MNVGISAATTEPRYRSWYRVLDSAALPKGAVRTVRLGGRDRVLFRTSTGAIGATDPICPHLGAHLGHGGTVKGCEIQCPWHGSRFCVKDGGVRQGPATFPEPTFETRVNEAGFVEVRAR